MGGITHVLTVLGFLQETVVIAAQILVELTRSLFADEVEADVVAVKVERANIVRCALDLVGFKHHVFLVVVSSVNDHAIVTVLNGSSSKLMTAYLVIDEGLPGEGKATKPRTVHDFMLAPDTQTVVRTDVF